MKTQMDERHKLQEDHLTYLTTVEDAQATALERAELKDISRRHLAELKRQPKDLKATEQRIKKMWSDTVKVQTRQYKTLSKHVVDSVPKDEQEVTLRRHKEEQTMRLSKLEEQYRMSLLEVIDKQTEKLALKQKEEMDKHKQMAQYTRDQLKAYQAIRLENLREKHAEAKVHLETQQRAMVEELARIEKSEVARVGNEHLRMDKLLKKHEAETRDIEAQVKDAHDALKAFLDAHK
jgi:thousand and one amino acid protein kinase